MLVGLALTSEICSLHPPSLNLIFENNQTSVKRWANGYFMLLDPSSSEVAPFINLPTSVDSLHNSDESASEKSTAKTSSAECIPEETSRGNMKVTFAEAIANAEKNC